MSESPATGWQLSQEQVQFLEELLTDAVLDKAESRLRAVLDDDRASLMQGLLEELEAKRAAQEPTDSEPSALELPEDVVIAADLRAMEDWVRARLDQVAARHAHPGTGVSPDDLRDLQEWVRERLDERASHTEAASAKARSADAAGPGFAVPRRLAVAVVSLFAVLLAAGWMALSARVDGLLRDRHERLVELQEQTESQSALMLDRSERADELFRDIGAAAAEIRDHANARAVRADIVEDLTASPAFVAATTGPQGLRGPVGRPERVAMAPGRFSFQNSSGATVAVMGQDQTGRGHAQIFGQSGAAVAYLGTDNGSEGMMRVSDTSGSSEVSVRAGRETGSVSVSTPRGQQAFVRAENGAFAEMGVANRSGDGGVVLRSQGGFGSIAVNGMSIHDFAEVFELGDRDGVVPGTVLSVAGTNGRLGPSRGPYDHTVIGVVSGAGGLRPGMTIGSRADGSRDLPVALSGQVYVRTSGEGGPIEVGDLLVASGTPGVAMRATDRGKAVGAVIGKAMEPVVDFGEREVLVRMFVMAR
jgi:hypothetical protein